MFYRKFVMLIFIFFACQVKAFKKDKDANKIDLEDPTNYSGKQDQDWQDVQVDLITLKGRVDTQAALVNNLIVEKNTLKGDALSKKLEEIKQQHQKYEQLVIEYNRKNDEYLTKYPERGLKEKRVYRRVKLKTLDSFVGDVTISGRLSKLHKKVLQQYPSTQTKEKKIDTGVGSAQEENKTLEEPLENVTDKINLKK